MTSPVRVSSAAYNERVPCRKYSKPCRSALPGERGKTGSSRSKVEGLDSAFLIHAENCRVQRWLKIQANDLCRLLFKLRIIADHVTTEPMRLQTEMTTDSADAGLAQAQCFGQSIAAPMSRSVARTLAGELQNPRLGLRGPSSAWTSAITRIEPGQTIFLKAPFPLPDILVTAIQPLANFPVRMARC